MKTKITRIFIFLIVLLLCCSNVFATDITTPDANVSDKIESSKTTFEIVDQSKCEMDFGDTGHFTKELTSYDIEKRELNITLSVTNSAQPETVQKPIEIFLVLDNSNSMNRTYKEKIKKDYVTQSATTFVNSLFEYFDNLKMGVVSFSSADPVTTPGAKLGTTADAKLLVGLSDSKDTVQNAITSYTSETGPYTNIEAGLSIAQSNFTNTPDVEKYIILISDGVPNLSVDTEHTLVYSGATSTNTKNRLQTLSTEGCHIYSVLTGFYEKDVKNPQAPTDPETGANMSYSQLAEEIFGTPEAPTVGKFYFIDYENLDTTVNDDIFGDITYVKPNYLKNIVIKDYFPQSIIDNFDFAQVTPPNIGSVTDVDYSDNSITWTIEELKAGETAVLVYKLKLKDTVDPDILNKELPTNEKVDIEFETPDGEKDKVTSDVSPKVKVNYEEPVVEPEPEPKPEPEPEPEPTPEPEPEPDDTVAPQKIPQTGVYTSLILVAIIGTTGFAITRLIFIKKTK